MAIKIPPGVFDILPENKKDLWRSSHLWNHVESIIKQTAEEFGFKEIRTPLFERTELFQRSIGDTTDIVTKEMYTFEDKGGRSMTLRPEGTASVMRSFVENHLDQEGTVHKFFYLWPMFRYERSQAGRYRQHHQFGVEAIGYGSPEQDAEVIDLLYTLYTRLGLKNLKVCLNSIGGTETRKRFKEALKEYLKGKFDSLSEDSQNRFEANPLRILDSKAPEDQAIVAEAPSILDFLNEEEQTHFAGVQARLKQIGIPFEVTPILVRGLDYYNKTVFEVVASELGAQNSIGGGGRYDGLLKKLGGADLPSMGFGCGIERVIQTMLAQEVEIPTPPAPSLFLIPLGDKAKEECFSIQHQLRQEHVSCMMDYSGRKLAKVMQLADHIDAKFVAVIGDKEIETGTVVLKRMATGETITASLHHLSRIMRVESTADDFLHIWQEMNQPFEHPSEAEFFIQKISSTINNTKKLTSELQKAMDDMQELF